MIERPKTAKDRIILALDVDNLKDARDLVRELKDYVGYFKVGLPLIVNYGFEAFRLLEEYGARCYYDCKFHDIPHSHSILHHKLFLQLIRKCHYLLQI